MALPRTAAPLETVRWPGDRTLVEPALEPLLVEWLIAEVGAQSLRVLVGASPLAYWFEARPARLVETDNRLRLHVANSTSASATIVPVQFLQPLLGAMAVPERDVFSAGASAAPGVLRYRARSDDANSTFGGMAYGRQTQRSCGVNS
jgi:hypothetical protein